MGITRPRRDSHLAIVYWGGLLTSERMSADSSFVSGSSALAQPLFMRHDRTLATPVRSATRSRRSDVLNEAAYLQRVGIQHQHGWFSIADDFGMQFVRRG